MLPLLVGLLVYLTGLCVGSFLNVVIFRLPRGLSISKPAWSFCPLCLTTLRWQDNLPVLGWLLLRARCRYCHKSISAQYPLVEAISGLAFVLTYYLLFSADARVLSATEAGIAQMVANWRTDVPLLLAWLVLVAVLVACAAMDLLLFMVDTRITDAALVAGIVLYAFWPRPDFFTARAATPAAAAAVVAFIVSGMMLWRTTWRDPLPEEQKRERDTAGGHSSSTLASPSARAGTTIAILAFVGLSVWLLAAASSPAWGATTRAHLAVPAALLALFAAMVLAGGQPRPVDDELRAAIEAEAPTARRLALRELLWLTPATVTATITYFVVGQVPAVTTLWQTATSWTPLGQFAPLGGAVFAIHGAIVAAAAGWVIRIFFTLAFGREAFGVGDIYILAAAGAVGGWDIALLGFLLSVFIALLGWVIGLLLKRPGMIPFGPPLAIGFLVALWLNHPAARRAQSYYHDLARAWHRQPEVVLLALGMLLVVLPASILLARFIRGALEPKTG